MDGCIDILNENSSCSWLTLTPQAFQYYLCIICMQFFLSLAQSAPLPIMCTYSVLFLLLFVSYQICLQSLSGYVFVCTHVCVCMREAEREVVISDRQRVFH